MTGLTMIAPPMIAATEAGSRHIERGSALPQFLQFDGGPSLDGWASIGNSRSLLEEQIGNAGWSYSFLAGKIETTALGFDRPRALAAALKRLASRVKSQKCNSFEIMGVTTRLFAGVFRVSVSAHARHFKEGPVSLGQ
jgi:hypothetical protein